MQPRISTPRIGPLSFNMAAPLSKQMQLMEEKIVLSFPSRHEVGHHARGKKASISFISCIIYRVRHSTLSCIRVSTHSYLRFMPLINVEAMYLHQLHTCMFALRNHLR